MAARRVLIIEDDPGVRWMLADVLGQNGYDVDTALDGQQALDKLAGPVPDLITLDLNMPVLDGVEVAHHIHGAPGWSTVPILILSAKHDAPDWAKKLGAVAYLQKPFDLKSLVAAVDRLAPLRNYQLKRP